MGFVIFIAICIIIIVLFRIRKGKVERVELPAGKNKYHSQREKIFRAYDVESIADSPIRIRKGKVERVELSASKNKNHFQPEKIFRAYDVESIADSPIKEAILKYDHSIVFYYIGELENQSKYALIIGTSDEWVNVITLNRAKEQTYETYGYSIKENRWSYGHKVYCAQEIRYKINEHVLEIQELMRTQEPVRKERQLKREAEEREIEQRAIELEEERKINEEKTKKMQDIFLPVVKEKFKTVNFEFNNNQTKHKTAVNDCKKSYFNIDLYEQTCNCDEYTEHCSKYSKFDIRRLCWHQLNIIRDRDLFVRSKDDLDDFILNNVRPGSLGILKDNLDNNLQYAIVIYYWSPDIFVITPQFRKNGYVTNTWKLIDNLWTPNKGSKVINAEIKRNIDSLFLNKD